MKDTGRINRRTNETIRKPTVVLEYNKTMGAVDNVSALMHPYKSTRKGLKWFRKLFEVFLDMCVLNAYVLSNKRQTTKTKHVDFVMSLVNDIVARHFHVRQSSVTPRRQVDFRRLTERHFPSTLPSTAARERPTRQCHVCGYRRNFFGKRLRRETRYFCAECNVPLCVVPCFKEYHTIENLKTVHGTSSDSD